MVNEMRQVDWHKGTLFGVVTLMHTATARSGGVTSLMQMGQ